jgi:hypothetical protein
MTANGRSPRVVSPLAIRSPTARSTFLSTALDSSARFSGACDRGQMASWRRRPSRPIVSMITSPAVCVGYVRANTRASTPP